MKYGIKLIDTTGQLEGMTAWLSTSRGVEAWGNNINGSRLEIENINEDHQIRQRWYPRKGLIVEVQEIDK